MQGIEDTWDNSDRTFLFLSSLYYIYRMLFIFLVDLIGLFLLGLLLNLLLLFDAFDTLPGDIIAYLAWEWLLEWWDLLALFLSEQPWGTLSNGCCWTISVLNNCFLFFLKVILWILDYLWVDGYNLMVLVWVGVHSSWDALVLLTCFCLMLLILELDLDGNEATEL